MRGQVVWVLGLSRYCSARDLIHMHQIAEVVQSVLSRVLRTQGLLMAELLATWTTAPRQLLVLICIAIQSLRKVIHAVA